jgi:hypothetical protein
MIREANHAAESKDPYPRYWSFLTVLLARELEAGAPTFPLATGDPSTARKPRFAKFPLRSG